MRPPFGDVRDSGGAVDLLDEAECRRLLGAATVGRLSFTDAALPAIVPVPFAVHDRRVIIPARSGSPMVAAVRGAVVAFGIDCFDPDTETGWSVTVVGPAQVLAALDRLAGPPWIAVLPAHWTTRDRCLIAVHLGLLRGWRARRSPAVPGHTPEPSAG